MPRVLFSACPHYGHVNPVLSLARAAHRAGHDVVVATGPDLVPHVERAGLTAWAVGPPAPAGNWADVDWLAYFAASGGGRADDLVPRAAQWRPDLVVAEETELAGPVAAAVTGARLAVHGLGIMPPSMIWDGYAAAVERLYDRWRLPFDAGVLRASAYLEVCPPSLRAAGDRPWPNAMPLRPSLDGSARDEPLSRSLDALPYADTVHLTLGTVFHGNRSVLTTALDGLRDLPVNVVVAAGPGADPASFGAQPPHVLVASYLPYAQLLPRCAVVVSQGGAGVLFGGLAHGVPQLALPQGADQARNAQACRDAGAGLVLDPADVTPAAVAAAVTTLLEAPGFATAAGAVAADIAAMPDADTTLSTLTPAPARP
jgi:UDP:flavonoid glycosyltransferase YjiC (YdhE family)